MKRQLLLGLGSLLMLSACKAPSVISGSEYNPSLSANNNAITAPAAATTPSPSAAVVTAPISLPSPSVTTPKTIVEQKNAIVAVTNVKAETPVKVEKVPFKQGVSSHTVERMALKNMCESKDGAGLLTPKGPVEVYRVSCNNGQVFMARCELRQCAPMSSGQ